MKLIAHEPQSWNRFLDLLMKPFQNRLESPSAQKYVLLVVTSLFELHCAEL